MEKLMMNLNSCCNGMVFGFQWYIKTIKENQWYIVPFILDIILIPLKLIIILPGMIFSKRFKQKMTDIYYEMREE